jgi:hypothetical protein
MSVNKMIEEELDGYRFKYRPKAASSKIGKGRSGIKKAISKAIDKAGTPGAKDDGGKRFVFTTENVEEIAAKMSDGFTIPRHENPWFKNMVGVRKAALSFMITESEEYEYAKSKFSVHYFAENYCKIKREDGTVGKMRLRDYQQHIIDLYTKNRFSILMASRQTGKCISGDTAVKVRIAGKEQFTTMGELYSMYGGTPPDGTGEVWNGDPLQKIAHVIFTHDLEVESMDGWVRVEEINVTRRMAEWKLKFHNGNVLYAADTHMLFTEKGWKPVMDLSHGDRILAENGEFVTIVFCGVTGKFENMYDLTTETGDYFAGGVLNHNTISASITLLHYITFNNLKGVMIVANKANTVIEIIDKIKSIYKLLPFFLKVGIVNWTNRTMTFDNGCRIKSEARTKEPSIGFTIDFLYMDEFAHIPNNISGHFYRSVVPTVSSINNSKIVVTSTPNGKNLFYTLVDGAERPKGDPLKNRYTAMRVYWWQVPGRLNSKIYLNETLLDRYKLTEQDVNDALTAAGYTYSKGKVESESGTVEWISVDHASAGVTIETVGNNVEKVRQLTVKDIAITAIGDVTNWQEEETALLGGDKEAFNQEYNLRFIQGSRTLFSPEVDERMNKGIIPFEWQHLNVLQKRLPYEYNELTWTSDSSLFNVEDAKKYHIVISVDTAEGLGKDFTVYNIFRVVPKSLDELKTLKASKEEDCFRLTQIGLWRANLFAPKDAAYMLYLLAFELFDNEKTKIVLELNGSGPLLLSEMGNVYDGDNDFSTSIMMRYKHRLDAKQRKIGLRVNNNKNSLVKNFQIRASKFDLLMQDKVTLTEVGNFVKMEKSSGNISYAAETGNDDIVMTCVHACTMFDTPELKTMVDEITETLHQVYRTAIKEALGRYEYKEVANYEAVRRATSRVKTMQHYGGANRSNSMSRTPTRPTKPMPGRSVNNLYGRI